MPSEIDRKLEPGEIVPLRWKHSPSSCRWPAAPGPISGQGTSVELGSRMSAVSGIKTDMKGENSRGASASPSNNFHHQSDFVNNDKNNDNGISTKLDWKSLKWVRSGSLSARGSGFSHLSGCKVIGVETCDTKMDGQQSNAIACLQSPSADASICMTPKTPDEVNSRKKPRLGWGEGLAKYEKKKVGPDDIVVDKENGPRDGVSSSESLIPSPVSLPGKSPSLTGNSESASPTTSCSFACSLSPGLEEKTAITATTMDSNTCNYSVASQNHPQGLPFSLENLDLTEGFNVSLLLDELLQTDDISAQGSGFAMDKLQVWKADISRKLEIAETEIDSLEHELKSDRDSSTFMPPSSSILKPCNNKKSDAFLEEKVSVSSVNMDTSSEKAECFQDRREDKSYNSIFDSNKAVSKRTSDELTKLLPNTHVCASVLKATSESDIKKKVEMRKRFQKFKERVTTLKFRTLQFSWKENLQVMSIKSGAKSHKKFESSSRMGYFDHQRHRVSSHSRLFSSGGSLSLVPTKEVVEYANMLLSDSRVKNYRNVAKMPTFILDKRERMSSRFISNNGLVENPKEVEKERSIVNLWTEEDKDMFMDKYTLFGKNFKKIASFFQHKTVADCVEFYYKNHKSDLFKKTKKKPDFAKGKLFNTHNTYLVTSGKRQNRETGPTSLDMLGAASEMVAIYCNEQETAAADVLAGICGSISSEALGSCITSSVDHQKVGGCSKRRSLNDVDEETCSDDSCDEEINSSIWTDEEKSSFIKALRLYGKDFTMISRCMGTRTSDQCRLFFSKARKCLGLDEVDLGTVSEATTGGGSGGGSDQDDTCMVDSGSGSGISHAESDCEAKNNMHEKGSNGNLEGAADSEAADVDGSPQNTCSDSASGAKVTRVSFDTDCVNDLDLNTTSETFACQETTVDNGFMMSNLFPKRDDVSSRLTFRKSSQRSQSHDEQRSQLQLDESLLLPDDGCLQMGTDLTPCTQQRRSSSLDIEKPSRSGDVKLFGKIITNSGIAKPSDKKVDSVKSCNLKSSYGFWDGNRIQPGLSSLPETAVLLAKFPAAFGNMPTLDTGNEQCNNLTVLPSF
ncbi:uncharacterized protein LOC143551696 [Bidens hawaiensis]|uniref:uncharacterized protein LOC143551696 n=1 Tax=Bidens hawaiensis TaxID=980011 RepID=UPI00404B1F10